jgi:hypothetical protein
MITTSADLLNGRFGQCLLRKRGKLRLMLGKVLMAKYVRLSNMVLLGEWTPTTPATGYAVSMTSWSARADSLIYALLSLVCQKPLRPKNVIVWLAEHDYPAFQTDSYLALREFGVEFQVCEDLKVHNKWLPMIESGYIDPYVICDDDVFYPDCWLEALMSEQLKNAFTGSRCHEMTQINGALAPYADWRKEVSWTGLPSHKLFMTGVGGAIVVPEWIRAGFRDRGRIADLCPKADDIWLNAAHVSAGIPRYKTRFTFPCLEVPTSVTSGLQLSNVDQGGNDQQMCVLNAAIGLRSI